MILIKLGILLGTYVSVRLYENYFKPEKENQSTEPQQNNNILIKNEVISPELEKKYDHYFKASVISLSLMILGPWYWFLSLLSFVPLIYACIPVLKFGEQQLKTKKIEHDVLFSILIFLSFLTTQEWSLAISLFFYHISLKILAKNQKQSKQMLTNVFAQQPNQVWLLKENVEIEVPLSSIQLDDIVVISTGEVIPIDGVIIQGSAMVDQHLLTGESRPIEKSVTDQVFASTLVISGKIYVQVQKAGLETTVHKIGEILSHTTAFKTITQMKGEKWADKIALPILSISALSIPTMGLLGANIILHSGFGNRIRVLAPLGTLNHLNLALHQGILVKDGRALEGLKKVDTVLFDKTGTLTIEQPKIGRITLCQPYQEQDILTYAAAAECKLTHPIARAIIKKAKDSHLILPHIEESQYQLGRGITVTIEDKVIRVGSLQFIALAGLMIPTEIEQAQTHAHAEGHSLVVVAINDQVGGGIEIQPTLRPEVKQIIKGLRQRGIQYIAIVSGDHQQPTQKLAESLGMDDYFYEILPDKKADIVEKLQREGRTVCFIGDGINDTIAMKKADVSISLSGASTIATDVAQVVFIEGTLDPLCDLFDISTQLTARLQTTLSIVASYSAINLFGVLFFNFNMITTVLFTNGGFLLALGYTLLPIMKKKKSQPLLTTEIK